MKCLQPKRPLKQRGTSTWVSKGCRSHHGGESTSHPGRRVLRPRVSLQICGRWEELVNAGRKQNVRPGQKYLWSLRDVHIQPFLQEYEWDWSAASADITKLRYVLEVRRCRRTHCFKSQSYQGCWKQLGGKCVQSSGQHRPATESMGTTAAGSGLGFRGVLLIYSSGSWVLCSCLLLGTYKSLYACGKIHHKICWYLAFVKLIETCHNLGYVCQLLKFVFKWGNYFLCRNSVLNNYYVNWIHYKLWR